MTNQASNNLFNRALENCRPPAILPIGVAAVGAWKYAFIYDLVARHFPEIIEQAHPITESEARRNLASTYLKSVGAARQADVARMFGWPAPWQKKPCTNWSIPVNWLLRSS